MGVVEVEEWPAIEKERSFVDAKQMACRGLLFYYGKLRSTPSLIASTTTFRHPFQQLTPNNPITSSIYHKRWRRQLWVSFIDWPSPPPLVWDWCKPPSTTFQAENEQSFSTDCLVLETSLSMRELISLSLGYRRASCTMSERSLDRYQPRLEARIYKWSHYHYEFYIVRRSRLCLRSIRYEIRNLHLIP